MRDRIWGTAIAVIAAALAFVAPASATTFCVPNTSFAACPGGSVASATVEPAIDGSAAPATNADGIPDRVVIAAGTHTDPNTMTASGTDALEIAGAGRGTGAGSTLLTSTLVGGNNFVLDLFAGGARPVNIHDLSIIVPASFTDNQGAVFQAQTPIFHDVDIESLNPGSSGGQFVGGGSFTNGTFYGASGGSLGTAISANSLVSGPLTVTGTAISNAVIGVLADKPAVPVTVRRTRINAPTQIGVAADLGATATVENSVIVDPGGTGVSVFSNSAGSPSAVVRHTTIARISGSTAINPVSTQVANVVGNGNASLTVSDSIIRGYPNSYFRDAPVSGSIGNADLSLTYSNFAPTGVSTGDGNLTLTANIDADPLFAGASDFHLLAGSPSIDAADPAPLVAVNDDFDGLSRPTDGNGDGTPRRDMGAFEYQPPVLTPPSSPTGTTPTTTTQTKKKCKKKRKRRSAVSAKKCKRKRR